MGATRAPKPQQEEQDMNPRGDLQIQNLEASEHQLRWYSATVINFVHFIENLVAPLCHLVV